MRKPVVLSQIRPPSSCRACRRSSGASSRPCAICSGPGRSTGARCSRAPARADRGRDGRGGRRLPGGGDRVLPPPRSARLSRQDHDRRAGRGRVDGALAWLAARLGEAFVKTDSRRRRSKRCKTPRMADVPPGVKGMNDILAPEVSKWQFLEQQARDVLEAFAYHELRTPVLEYTPLFVRSVGEVTDIVEKQMYTFDDRDGRSVSLRPEGTASAVRAYVENAQWNKEPVTRWYYIGPMFRHERAQRGRLRQFYQVGAEVFGSSEPSLDAEMIAMLVTMLARFGLEPARSRSTSTRWASRRSARPIATSWSRYFSRAPRRARRRFAAAAGDQPAAHPRLEEPRRDRGRRRARPSCSTSLGEASRARFARVRALLSALGVKHEVDPGLVRGLDYYTATIFEIKTKAGELGAQNTVAGGGRYDRLVSSLGGQKHAGDRLRAGHRAGAAGDPGQRRELRARAGRVLRADGRRGARLRAADRPRAARQGHPRSRSSTPRGKLGKMMGRANKLRARAAVIIGSNEIASGKLTVKDLAHGTQSEVAVADLEAKIRQLLD